MLMRVNFFEFFLLETGEMCRFGLILLSQPNGQHLCCPRESEHLSFAGLQGRVAQFENLLTKLPTSVCWNRMDFL